mgnify:CR=1 FL=1
MMRLKNGDRFNIAEKGYWGRAMGMISQGLASMPNFYQCGRDMDERLTNEAGLEVIVTYPVLM